MVECLQSETVMLGLISEMYWITYTFYNVIDGFMTFSFLYMLYTAISSSHNKYMEVRTVTHGGFVKKISIYEVGLYLTNVVVISVSRLEM